MSSRNKHGMAPYVWILTSLLVSGALAQAPPAPPPTIPPSYDFFKSPAGLSSEQDFAACPVPGTLFEEASTEPLTGCATFDGTIHLQGVPLVTFNGTTVGVVDTAVYRTTELDFGEPTDDVTVTTGIELQALNLASVDPVEIRCDQGTTSWEVTVKVDGDTGPSLGEMEVTLDYPDNLGGTASSYLDICPRVTFTRTGPGASGGFELDPCDVGCEFNLLGETSWSYTAPRGASGLTIPGLTAENFFFTEPLSAQEQFALQTLAAEEGDCPCELKYPHLSENHRHQACLPCPCDSDQEPPDVTVPPDATLECSAYRASAFPTDDCIVKTGFVCWDEWFDQVVCTEPNGVGAPDCTNEPFKVKSCAEDQPLQLTAACENVGGFANVVDFKAEDCCGNDVTKQATLTVIDTTAPVVTPRDDILFTLAPPANPPNGDYVCFDHSDLTGTRAPEIKEVCHKQTWVFTDCTSDQPDNGVADGNTTDDCHVCGGTGDTVPECAGAGEGERFCARAERAGNDPAGRLYSIEITATDECNLADTEVIGKVFVPRGPQPPPPPAVCEVKYEGGRNNSWQSFDIAALFGLTGTVTVDSIFQDEETDSDNRCPDGRGVGTSVAEVRAGRDGGGDGRFYHITFSIAGGVTVCPGNVLKVCIPHGNEDCNVDDSGDGGPLHDSTVCP